MYRELYATSSYDQEVLYMGEAFGSIDSFETTAARDIVMYGVIGSRLVD